VEPASGCSQNQLAGLRILRTLGAVAPVVAVRRALAAVSCLSREARAG